MRKHIFIICILLLSACVESMAGIPAAGYTRYQPKPDSVIPFQFDYPDTWEFHSDEDFGMSCADPLKVTHDPKYNVSNNAGFIDISRFRSALKNITLAEYVEKEILDINNRSKASLLSSKEVEIDGVQAYQVIIHLDPVVEYKFSRLDEWYYLEIDNVLYIVQLLIPEVDRQNAFGQGFDYLVSTIQIDLNDD